MGASWRVGVAQGERTALITKGSFAYVRNPTFTTLIVTGTGLMLMVPNILAVASLIALVIAVELQVRIVEEPYLHRTHGSGYCAYCAQAGRFVPGIGRQRGDRRRGRRASGRS